MRKSPAKAKIANEVPDKSNASFAPIIKAFSKDNRVSQGGRFGSVSLNLNSVIQEETF